MTTQTLAGNLSGRFAEWALQIVEDIGNTGLMFFTCMGRIFHGKIYWEPIFQHIEQFGIGSLPIVMLSASFIGMAISVQIARELVEKYGADIMVGGFVSLTMFRELAPVFVAVIVAGNVGASITAELGTMKVTDQIDAMKVFNINVFDYLVIPRLISTAISGPLLTIFGVAISLLAGQMFTELFVNVSADVFWDSAQYNTHLRDVLNMLAKSLAFSLAIAIIACYNGLSVSGGSEGVGLYTTRTVVSCLLAIFIINYMLTSLFFQI